MITFKTILETWCKGHLNLTYSQLKIPNNKVEK
jgi:hypothetical protein